MGTRKCRDCHQRKDVGEFYVCSVSDHGVTYYSSYCKPCNIVRNTVYGAEHREARRRYSTAHKKKVRGTVANRARLIYEGMVATSRKKGFHRPEFSIAEIEVILEGGVCCKTGIPFVIESGRKSPWLGSPDRIDPTLGYSKQNVQWVCWMYNVMKANYSEEDVEKFIQNLIEHGDF